MPCRRSVAVGAGEQGDRACIPSAADILKLIADEDTSWSRRKGSAKLVVRFGAARYSGRILNDRLHQVDVEIAT